MNPHLAPDAAHLLRYLVRHQQLHSKLPTMRQMRLRIGTCSHARLREILAYLAARGAVVLPTALTLRTERAAELLAESETQGAA